MSLPLLWHKYYNSHIILHTLSITQPHILSNLMEINTTPSVLVTYEPNVLKVGFIVWVIAGVQHTLLLPCLCLSATDYTSHASIWLRCFFLSISNCVEVHPLGDQEISMIRQVICTAEKKVQLGDTLGLIHLYGIDNREIEMTIKRKVVANITYSSRPSTWMDLVNIQLSIGFHALVWTFHPISLPSKTLLNILIIVSIYATFFSIVFSWTDGHKYILHMCFFFNKPGVRSKLVWDQRWEKGSV